MCIIGTKTELSSMQHVYGCVYARVLHRLKFTLQTIYTSDNLLWFSCFSTCEVWCWWLVEKTTLCGHVKTGISTEIN